MADYVPSKVFKFVSNQNLESIFKKFDIELDIDWENRRQSDTKALVEQWATLKADKESGKDIGLLDEIFQHISDLANAKTDSSKLAETLAEEAIPVVMLPDKFAEWNRYEQAAYIYLEEEASLWRVLTDLVFAEDMSNTRKWAEYNELPKEEPDVSGEKIQQLEQIVCDFFKPTKKCESSHIEKYLHNGELYYFFATLDDSPRFLELKSQETREYEPTPAVMPYRVIFAYNFEEGEFSLFAEISKAEKDKLAAEILKELVGYDDDVKRLEKPCYNLDVLNKRGFAFDTNPADCIQTVRVKALTVAPLDNPSAEMTFKDKSGDVYDCMDEYLDRSRLPDGHAEAQKAIITMKIDNPELRFRSLTFTISRSTCNLKSMNESKRELGEKLIKRWGFKNANAS